jgi:UDP-N-acetylglucosamine 2-epimerase
VGNRPQFIKAAPLAAALGSVSDHVLVHTGQHYDAELSQVFFDELGLAPPDHEIEAGSGSHAVQTAAMLTGLEPILATEQPDLVLVYGDTNSTLAGAEAAGEVPVAHVEAGLRSFDLSMPEERNRIAVDRISALLFCPDKGAAAQLASERVTGRREVVGDVMRDALETFLPIAQRRSVPYMPPYAVLTLHREANTEPARLRRLISELNKTGWTFVFPVHPRTRRVLDEHGIQLASTLHAVPPLGYLEMLALVAGAARVVTDSGGLQKEAYWLGVPCITLRNTTEWTETVAAGANTLVDPEEPVALGEALAAAQFPEGAPSLYGDGRASARIARSLLLGAG